MGKSILIVEDDATLQRTLQEYLQTEGFDVFSAVDGEEALATIENLKPDLILLDIILPKKDGYEVIKEIRAREDMKETPIVLLTNLGSINDVEKALNLGATTYLVKADYTLEEIAGKIKNLLKME